LQIMDRLCQLSQSEWPDRVFSPLEVYDCALRNAGLARETSSRKLLCLCSDLIEILCVDYSLVLAARFVRRVQTYRRVLHQYLYRPESKFAGPDGRPCDAWTRGVLQRRHIIAADFKYCGKEVKPKLEQGPADHDIDYKCKIYENGRVAADPETRQLARFSERKIAKGTRLHRKPIRLLRRGGAATRRTYQKIATFLQEAGGAPV
jgi:hypothetical protein